MRYSATVGPLQFRFCGAGVAAVPPLTGRPLVTADGARLLTLTEGGWIFLALDHREDARPDVPAYVELWLPAGAIEAPLRGMFVLCDSYRATEIILQPFSLESLALALELTAGSAAVHHEIDAVHRERLAPSFLAPVP